MASIEKRGKNSYRLVAEAGYNTKGKRIKRTKTVNVKNKREAEVELALFVAEIEAGLYIAPEKMIFSLFVDEWVNKFVIKNLEAKTIENYLFHTKKRILPHFGHMRIAQIKTMHIMEFLNKLSEPGERADGKTGSLGSASIVYIYRVLRSIFSKAEEWKVIKGNPMSTIKKPKEKRKKIDVYDEQEARKLFDALQDEDIMFRVLVILALTTGLRRGEILGLEWQHINLDKGILDVVQTIPIFKDGQPIIKPPKTDGSVRKISLPNSVIEDLKHYQLHQKKERLKTASLWEGKSHNFLFCNTNGRPFYPKTISEKWRAFHKRNKQLKYIRFHDLRHTSATLLINQGIHAKIISERLGHTNIKTTMDVYGHVIQSAEQAAALTFETILLGKKQS